MEQHVADTQRQSEDAYVRPRLPDDSSTTQRRHGAANELQELLTVDEVAALLKVSRSWVYEHTRARGLAAGDRLPHIKIGKYVRFDARAVRAFLEKKCRTT